MIRRYGEAVIRDQTYHMRPGAYAILTRGNNVLVTFQEEPLPEIQLPGGGIDPGESALQALHREVLEETGWSITQPRRLGAFRRFTFMPEYDRWSEKICHIYIARPALRHGPPREPGHTAFWLEASEAVGAIASDGDRAFMLRLFDERQGIRTKRKKRHR